MKIALYVTKEKNYVEFSETIKETILELDPETEIIEIEDERLDQENWENQQMNSSI